MKNNHGIIKILILIICSLIVGSIGTYWYIEKGIPAGPAPLEITYKDVPKDGEDIPYQAIIGPEPRQIDPDSQLFEGDKFLFEYPKDWTLSQVEDKILLRDPANASTTLIFTSVAASFPDLFKPCATSTSVVVQGKDVNIDFLCDTTKNTKLKDELFVIADTQQGYVVYGSVSKKKGDGVYKEKYIKAFTHLVQTLELK